MRTCNVCLKEKELNEFRDGKNKCKKCNKIERRKNYKPREKKQNPLYFIYCLKIDDVVIYVGKTENMKERYKKHFTQCYNSNVKGYNSKKYLTIRQLNISKEQFKDFVKYEILYENIPEGYEKIMENLVIKLYRENGVNLLNELNGIIDEDKLERNRQIYIENHRKDAVIRAKKHYEANKEEKKKYAKEYYKQKIKCEI